MDPYAWSWNLEALLVVPLLVLAYVVALQRHPAPWWRIACFGIAMALVLAVSITPIETIALQFLLSIHLLQNVVLAEWAPLLAVLAIPPSLAEALTGSQAARLLTHPAVAEAAVRAGATYVNDFGSRS